MKDVTDNAKNNFGDTWTPCISPVLGQCLKKSATKEFVHSKLSLCCFLAMPFFPRRHAITMNLMNFFYLKGGSESLGPPSVSAYVKPINHLIKCLIVRDN